MRIVAGDIGGTKTLLQMVEVGSERREVVLERRYESGLYPTFDAMFREFVQLSPGSIESACFAVAGPVLGGRATVTNLPWKMEEAKLSREFAIPSARLVNDFYAVAAGVPLLGSGDVVSLNGGDRDLDWPVGILGAGTGLGEAFVIPEKPSGWRVLPSEGGHADFAPMDELQCDLLEFLFHRYGHVSYERLLSGEGLTNIHNYLRDHVFKGETSPASVAESDEEMPPRISRLAEAGDPLALRTFEVFVDIYAAEAANVALKVIARGGVYLAGGIAAKNVARFDVKRFTAAFTRKGRFSDFMLQFPVDLITNPKVGLIGAAALAERG
ncbi:MAG: glucokinase [Thermoanaerobaculia bacterium]